MHNLLAERYRTPGWWHVQGQRIPPAMLGLLAIGSVQVGAALASQLFPLIGSSAAVYLRTLFAAILLLAIWRPRLRGYTRRHYVLLGLYGVTLAAMNLAFYAAISRIPLGLAVTLEFVGPLGVAVAGSRRVLDLLWVVMAGMGVVLLSPFSSSALDGAGVAFALLAGCGWASYILVGGQVGKAFAGGSGLALGLLISTLLLTPVGILSGGPTLFTPHVLLLGIGVSLLSSAIPFSLEFIALQRMPARVFGILMSLEPAVAALVGLFLLGEQLDLRALTALVLVTTAAAGAFRFSARRPEPGQPIDSGVG